MRKFRLGKKLFLAVPHTRKICRSNQPNGFCSETFTVENIFWLDGEEEEESMVGVAYSQDHAEELIREYFTWSFCLPYDHDEETPWCIRKLSEYGRQREIWSSSLCLQTKENSGSDLVAPVSLEQNKVCEGCAWAYWQHSLWNDGFVPATDLVL